MGKALARPERNSGGRLPPCLLRSLAGALALFSVIDLQGFVPLPHRVVLPLACFVLLAAAWSRRSMALRRDFLLPICTGLAVGVALAVWTSLENGTPGATRSWTGRGLDVSALGRRLSVVCTAWTTGLLLLGAEPPGQGRRIGVARKRWTLLCILLVALVGAAASRQITAQRYVTIFDENLYLLQSRLFDESGFGRPIVRSEQPFFLIRQTFIRDGRLRTEYPPGWPYLLAVCRRVGLQKWCGALLLAIAAGFVYLLGCRIHSAGTGLVAAGLLVTSPLVLRYAGTYMAHTASLASIASAAWLLLRTEEQAGVARFGSWLSAGALLGVAVAIRPLTGAVIALSLALWLVCRGRLNTRDMTAAGVIASLAALLPLGATLYYNRVTTGDSLTFGYQAANDHLHDLGFGQRGFVDYDSLARPYVYASDFTLRTAVDNTAKRAWDLTSGLMPAFLLPALIVLGAYHRCRVDWVQISVFFLLPAAQFFYFYSEPRFLIELLPFLFIGIGILFAQVTAKQRLAARAVLLLALVGNLLLSAGAIWGARPEPLLELFHQIDMAQQRYSRLLVFVSQGCRLGHPPPRGVRRCGPYTMLYWYDVDTFPGPVVVARDLGPRDTEIIERFPDRVPMRVTTDERSGVTSLVPYFVANMSPGDAKR